VNDKLKCFVYENYLSKKYKFKEELGLKEPKDMNELLIRLQHYTNYEEKWLEAEVVKNKQP